MKAVYWMLFALYFLRCAGVNAEREYKLAAAIDNTTSLVFIALSIFCYVKGA